MLVGVTVGVVVLVGVTVGVTVLVGVTDGVGKNESNAASHLLSGTLTSMFNSAVHPPNKSSYFSRNGVQVITSSK